MKKHKIDLTCTQITGRILDIGGGGEGVIGRRYGDNVVAIDILKDELEETPGIGLKIVMDAADMSFLDNQFENVTCFYSLMFMGARSLTETVREAYRVMKPGGYLYVWDAEIPFEPMDGVFVVQLDIQMTNEKITPGFGIGWNRGQSAESILDLCKDAGFICNECLLDDGAFFIKLQKLSI